MKHWSKKRKNSLETLSDTKKVGGKPDALRTQTWKKRVHECRCEKEGEGKKSTRIFGRLAPWKKGGKKESRDTTEEEDFK